MSMPCLICWQHTITNILNYEHNEEEDDDATLVLVDDTSNLGTVCRQESSMCFGESTTSPHAICEGWLTSPLF